ncbi:hypothetical protein GIB67_036895 [Kingdonia uniflora]|uniref:Uncharacterized protein n=1 Tax=Kingdonia uniflora TaxID=39325 RepID=A0A7J7LS98_9MAGN|nr:hypothetical protein GIB67_036895 [Kingdonia uniflora]
MLPPHENVAKSMFEGVGRTLKGRDLRQVRNAIWHKTGMGAQNPYYCFHLVAALACHKKTAFHQIPIGAKGFSRRSPNRTLKLRKGAKPRKE